MYNNVEDDVNVDDDVDDDGDVVDDGHGDGDGDDDDDDDDDGYDNGDDDNDDDDEIYICPCHKKHFVRACAVEMHMDMSQEAFCAEIYKGRRRIPGPAFCASLRSRNAHGHVTRSILRGNLHGNCRTRIPGPAFCASLQSKCTWTCHKRHFVRKFIGKIPKASDATSIEHRASTLTVKTPQCGHTVWGKIEI